MAPKPSAEIQKAALERHRHAQQVRERTKKAKAHFDKAHLEGMQAIRRRDYEAVSRAIADEVAAIDELNLPGPRGRTRKA